MQAEKKEEQSSSKKAIADNNNTIYGKIDIPVKTIDKFIFAAMIMLIISIIWGVFF